MKQIYILTKTIKSILEQQIWLILTSKTDRLERSLANRIRAYFSKQQKEIIREFKKSGEFVYDSEKWKRELENLFESELPKIIELGYKRAISENEHINKKNWEDELFLLWKEYSKQHVGNLIVGIDNTSKQKIQSIIFDGVKEGHSIQKIAGLIAQEFDTFKSTRSLTIARTETMGATNWSYMKQMERYGYTQKQYVTAMDEHVCPVCAPLNGKVISITDDFSVALKTKGEKTTIFKAPHPPMHPNCRCTIVVKHGEKLKIEQPDEINIIENMMSDSIENWSKIEENMKEDFYYYMNKYLDKVCKDDGECFEELMERIIKNLEDTMNWIYKKADIYTAVQPETLKKIIEDGRFKNAVELGKSSVSESGEYLDYAMHVYLNLIDKYDKKLYPKYGFWWVGSVEDLTSPFKNGLAQFGKIYIKFKPKLKKQSAFYMADSYLEDYELVPFTKDYRPIVAVNHFNNNFQDNILNRLLIQKNMDKKKFLDESLIRHTEVNIYGNITTKDIDKVYLPLNAGKGYSKKDMKELEKWLKEKGIDVEYYDYKKWEKEHGWA